MDDDKDENPDADDDETSGDAGESSNGTMVSVGGATSKADRDAALTKKQQKKLMREASVKVRAMSDSGDAMDKAQSSQFKILDSEIKGMTGLELNNYLSSNPSQMDKVGTVEVRQKMINDGYGKQLDNLTHGTYEASQKQTRMEVMRALMAKPLSEMKPAEQSFVWDKLSELGEVSGKFEGNIGALEAAVGGFVLSSPAGEQLVKEGIVTVSGGIKAPDPGLKISFTIAQDGEQPQKKAPAFQPPDPKNIFKPGK